MSAWWAHAPRNLQLFKEFMIAGTGLSKDALHVYAGLLLFLGVRMVWRRRGGWVLGWLTALAVAMLVEYIDMQTENIEANLQPDSAHWHDVWNTLFWPTVLLLIGRWLQPRPKLSPAVETSGDLADQSFEETPPV
jgi:hypothetical protein